jgi:hypothetical protein
MRALQPLLLFGAIRTELRSSFAGQNNLIFQTEKRSLADSHVLTVSPLDERALGHARDSS